MNKLKFHGLTSLALIGIDLIIGLIVIINGAWLWVLLYLTAIGALAVILTRSFCAKCPCKDKCAHVILGKAAKPFSLPPGPYSHNELLALLLTTLVLFGLPQFWLWQTPLWLAIYWALLIIALVQIRLVICPACDNCFCPLNPGKK